MHAYRFSSNTWTDLGNPNVPNAAGFHDFQMGHAIWDGGNKVYARQSDTFYEYDLTTGTWTSSVSGTNAIDLLHYVGGKIIAWSGGNNPGQVYSPSPYNGATSTELFLFKK